MNSTELNELTIAARLHLRKLSFPDSGYVSERLLFQPAWNFMSECDNIKTFAQPVNEPGYTNIVKKRMALSNMKTKLTHGVYGSLEEFGDDIQLIVENCKLFNVGNIYYTEQAERFQAAWNIFYAMAVSLRKGDSVGGNPTLTGTNTSASDGVDKNSVVEPSGNNNNSAQILENKRKRSSDADDLQDYSSRPFLARAPAPAPTPTLPPALATAPALNPAHATVPAPTAAQPPALATTLPPFPFLIPSPALATTLPPFPARAPAPTTGSLRMRFKIYKLLLQNGDEAAKQEATRELFAMAKNKH